MRTTYPTFLKYSSSDRMNHPQELSLSDSSLSRKSWHEKHAWIRHPTLSTKLGELYLAFIQSIILIPRDTGIELASYEHSFQRSSFRCR